ARPERARRAASQRSTRSRLKAGGSTVSSARAWVSTRPIKDRGDHELTERQWQRWARPHRLSEARTRDLWEALRQPQLPVPLHVVRAKARLMQTLLAQLAIVVGAVGDYREAIEDFFASMPAAQWARTLPIGDHGITAPTLWARPRDAPG